MNDILELLSSTSEKLNILEAEALEIEKDPSLSVESDQITAQAIGFLLSTPTDYFDIIYNS